MKKPDLMERRRQSRLLGIAGGIVTLVVILYVLTLIRV